ncbi:MAG: hypothetical protein NT164_06605 [Verrucomicrobiae bacterium]|nr:hypothetical protein [Verrucomicrobiae bacterium]
MPNFPFSCLSAAGLQASGSRKILDSSVNEQKKEPLEPDPGSMQGIPVTIGTLSKRPSIFSFAYWFPSYSSSNRPVVATQEHAITRAAPSSSKGLRSWSNWTLPSFAFMRKTPSEKEMVEKITDYCFNNRLDLSMLQRDPTKELVSYQIAGEDLKPGEVRDLLRSIFATIKEVRPEGLGFVLQNLYTHCNARNVQEREVHAGEALTSLKDRRFKSEVQHSALKS